MSDNIWIEGLTRSGKTTRLVSVFGEWVSTQLERYSLPRKKGEIASQLTSSALVLAANSQNRRILSWELSHRVKGGYPVICKTPLGFIADEVELFLPILFDSLELKAQFSLRLRPETEQELATRLWRTRLLEADLPISELGESRLVRRILDLLQLAGVSCIPIEQIPERLIQGQLSVLSGEMVAQSASNYQEIAFLVADLLQQWRKWCLDRGLLSYGLMCALYWQYLLPNETYQHHLQQRYHGIFADDVDDYPAIARYLFELLMSQGAFAAFTYNPCGQVRLGLNADPFYLQDLASHCQIEYLSHNEGLAALCGDLVLELVNEPTAIRSLPPNIQSLQTVSRAEMLRQTADIISEAVGQGQVKPEEIAIIAPGLDEIARYTLIEILSHRGIPIQPLNEQRPLISSPQIRALLTLLTLIYPGLGRLVDKDTVAEMLVILTSQRGQNGDLILKIDPVRAGLIADYCYHPDPEAPRLLKIDSFSRWDRLGHRAVTAYNELRDWLETTKQNTKQQSFTEVITLLDQTIRHFYPNITDLPYDQLSALREFIETLQHYGEVDRRLRQNEPISPPVVTTIAQFIQLLRRGTITANPLPITNLMQQRPSAVREYNASGITLATIFQYRSSRQTHRWHFWLDTASRLWEQGGAATIFASPLFLRDWEGNPWQPEDQFQADQERLQRILRDLLGRVTEKLYLCHSDLAVNGTEQIGPLLTLVNAAN